MSTALRGSKTQRGCKPVREGDDMEQIDLQKVFRERKPVEFRGTRYLYISAVVYRSVSKQKHIMQLELMDKCGHSVVIANPDEVYVIHV